MSRRSVQAMSVKELPLQDEAMAEFLGAVNTGQVEGPVDRTSEGQHNISHEMHPSVSIPSCWAEPTFWSSLQAEPSNSALCYQWHNPRCRQCSKAEVCGKEAHLWILWGSVTNPRQVPQGNNASHNHWSKIPGKNPRFEAVAEWAKQSLQESLFSISMIDNGLFEKYHFQAWKVRSTLCIMCLGCKIKRSFLYFAPWILKWCRRIPGLFQIPCLGLILRSQLILAQSKLCQFVGKLIGEGVVGRKWWFL